MIQIKFEVETKRYDDKIRKALSEIVEKAVNENGCTRCHGKNLTVYINEIGRKNIDGYFYCHDCEDKGNIHFSHDLFDVLDDIEKKFKDVFRGL